MTRLTNTTTVIVGPVKVGLDPEFLLFDRHGGFVPARDIFGRSSTGDEVGVDECDNTGELRPKEGTPAKVIKNTTDLLTKLGSKIKARELLVYAGVSTYADDNYEDIPLGGHIHFNIPYCEDFVEALDAFIGVPMLRMADSDRREDDAYGELSEWESKPYGFEYRTPPSFIGKPDLFGGVIAVAFCVASTWKTICNSGKTFEYECAKKTGAYAKEYEKLTYYTRYKKHINAFLEYVNNDELSMEETDVLAAWAIRDAICLEDISI